MTEPTTEAGRRHILRFFSFADHEEADEAEQSILAIEAEARAGIGELAIGLDGGYERGRADALREARASLDVEALARALPDAASTAWVAMGKPAVGTGSSPTYWKLFAISIAREYRAILAETKP